MELAIFRIVQESLANIHLHAQSPRARIRATRLEDTLVVEVSDDGKGMAVSRRGSKHHPEVGIGVTDMRERATQLGGTLEIESSKRGTTVRATLPLPDAASPRGKGSPAV
jgi:two-component system NarL family sensor kinase